MLKRLKTSPISALRGDLCKMYTVCDYWCKRSCIRVTYPNSVANVDMNG